MTPSSPAQVVGYFAFVLGIAAFLQKSDGRLKLYNASQGLIYSLHFVLLGNFAASASALVSSARSFLALRFRSLILAAATVAVHLGVGAAFARSPAAWLPVVGSCCATVAIFTLDGIPLRSVLLLSTMMWLANNILSRSIGGTALELGVASANISTMLRMSRSELPPTSP